MNDLPLVDLAQLERLNEWGGADLQRKMIDLFLTHSIERLNQIKEGISTGNSEQAETGAHTDDGVTLLLAELMILESVGISIVNQTGWLGIHGHHIK